MAKKNVVQKHSNCPKAFETAVAVANSGSSKATVQKRKEAAKQTLYINRI